MWVPRRINASSIKDDQVCGVRMINLVEQRKITSSRRFATKLVPPVGENRVEQLSDLCAIEDNS